MNELVFLFTLCFLLQHIIINRYTPELDELERIDNEKERQFKRLELLLRGFDKYEEIRTEFNIVTTTTTTTSSSLPGASVTMNVSGAPVAVVDGTLEARVAQLELNYATLKAEFEAEKAQQALKNQTFDALIKVLQAAKPM